MIPLPVLFAKPAKTGLRISPCERWLAWLARDSNGRLNLWAQKRTPPSAPAQITFREDRDVCDFFTFSADGETLLYLAEPSNGSELYHLYAVDLDDSDRQPRDLISDPNVTAAMGFIGNVQLWTPPHTPREVFVATSPGSLFWDVSRLNIDTCERTVIITNPMSSLGGKVLFGLGTFWSVTCRFVTRGAFQPEPPRAPVGWFPDRQFNFRGRVEASIADLSLYMSAEDKGTWRPLQSIAFKELNMQLVGSSGGSGTMHMDFSNDGNTVDVHTCVGCDTTSVVRLCTHTGQELEIVANAPECDITGFLKNPKSGAIEAIKLEHEKPRWVVLCDTVRADISFLENNFSGCDVIITKRPLIDTTWVICVATDHKTDVYYLYERDQKQVVEIFNTRPQLENWTLGTMEPIWVKARDDEKVLCLLSRPPHVKDRGPLPLVLFIHGGPNARDHWGFDPVAQLLVSRGMVVLQVNYRGSTGLGTRWVQLGMEGAFSTTMQNDVEDAANWAIQEGVADVERVAILGASFGGYSALFHMTLGRLKLRCGVAICPVSAVGKAGGLGFRGDPLAAQYFERVYGAAAKDLTVAQAASPLHHVDRISAPLLLIHGEKDPRVPIAHSDAVASAARRRGLRCTYVKYNDEGHGIRKEANSLDLWSRVERFLCSELSLPIPPACEIHGSSGYEVPDSSGHEVPDSKSTTTCCFELAKL